MKKIMIKMIDLAITIKGAVRISNRDVPHILVPFNDITYSVCYFGSTDTWRIFFPYPSSEQIRITLNSREEVINYFKNLRGE